ncbi:MAG: flagellar basal body P-ring formation protein FlgA, partial [Desulfamplus sp.]|nr:flagellar basal body P-ring formation protein FlgA [Desulfamplus sp.]
YESYVNERLDGKDFEIREFSVRGLDTYPEGEVVLSPPVSNSSELKGRVTLYVKVQVDRKDYGRISLSGWIDIFDDVLCASRSLTRGKILESGDVHIERVNIANLHGDYFSSDQDVIGRVLTRNAPMNKAVTPNMVDDAALVHKGDKVKIVADRGTLRLVTLGIIKSDGKMDDTVQVQNMTSGKTINAVVTGKESVKVFY